MNVKNMLNNAARVGAVRAAADARADRRNLIVVRESQKYDLDLLLNMGQQTLEPVRHLPGVDELLEILADDARAIRFLMGRTTEGLLWLQDHDGVPLRQRDRIYGWRFQVAGTHFLIAASSAMGDDEEDLDNPFSADLMAAIEQIRPDDLWAGPFTRLVRRKMLGELLGEKCRKRKVTVHVKEVAKGITLDDMTGDMLWSMWCQMAEADLKMTVTRLFTGKLYGSKRSEWSFHPDYLPLNAALTNPDRRIVGREELACLESRDLTEADTRALAEARLTVELAAEAWDLRMTDTPMSSTEFLRRLSDDPAVQARIRHHKATHRGAPLTKLSNHDAGVRDRVKMVPIMLEGEYLQIQGLPLTGITEDDLHGWPVYKFDEDDEQEKGFTVLSWKMPKLEGIDPDVAEKAALYADHIDAQQRDRGLGVIGEQAVMPLTSIWSSTKDGQPERRLVSTTGVGPGYQWKEAVRGDRASFHANSEVLGKFRLASFNRKFVTAIEQLAADDQVDLASVTMKVSPTPGRAAGPDDDGLEELRVQRTGVQATLDAYLLSASASSGAAAALADLISEAKTSLARLDRDIELQATQALAATEPGAVDEGFVGTLADLCAITETAEHPLPPAINRAWRELLVPGEVTCERWSPWAVISFALAIPTDTGLHETRQVSFTVANKTRGFLRTGPDGSEQIRRDAYYRRIAPEAYRLRMVGQRDLGELAGLMDIDTPTLSSNLVGLLKGTKGPYQGTPVYSAASKNLYRAGLDCAVPSTRAIVYTLLAQAGRLPWDLPGQTSAIPTAPNALPASVDGLDVAETLRWIDHLDDTHLAANATWSVGNWSAGGEHDSRQVLAYVTAHADPTLAGLMAAMGWKTRAAADRHLLGRRATGGRRQPLVIEIHPDDRSAGSGSVAYDQQRLRPIVCPWADCGWDRGLHVLPVPECPDAVICPACRRMPSDPTLVFPSSYLQQFEGPYGNNTANSKNTAAASGTRIVASPTQIPAAWRRTRDRQRPA